MILLSKYSRISLSFSEEILKRGGHQMNHCDLILNLVDKYIEEKEKNILLQQQLQQYQQEKDEKQAKTSSKQ